MRKVVVVVVLAVARGAYAQPVSAQAEVLFRQGKQLMAAGKIAEACAAFDASQKLDPTVSTLINQAGCREKNGQFATAWGLFLDAARQTRSATDPGAQQLHAVATERAAKLEPRLSTLRIAVPADHRVDGLEILRDGQVLDPATWNQALPIDGGTYQISAGAPGKAIWSTSVVVAAERDARSLEIPGLRPAEPRLPEPRPPADPEGESAARAPVPSPPVDRGSGGVWSTRRAIAVGAASGGVLALAAGAVLGMSAKGKQRDAHALCADPALDCEDADRANELISSGHNRAIGANVAFGVAAAAAVAAGVLWFTGAPESRRRVVIVPDASSGRFITVSGRF